MNSSKLKYASVVTLVAAFSNYILAKLFSLIFQFGTYGVSRIKMKRSAYYALFYGTPVLRVILAMLLGILVLKLTCKVKLSGGKKALLVFLPAVISELVSVFMSAIGLVNRSTNTLLSVLTILIIAVCSWILVPGKFDGHVSDNAVIRTQKEEAEYGNKITLIGFFVFLGVFAIAYAISSRFFVSCGIAIVGFYAFLFLIGLFKKGSKEETAKIKQAMAFYEECKKNNIQDFNSEKNIARAEAIAKATGKWDDVTDYVAFYELGRKYSQELQEKVAAEEKQERVATLLAEEKKQSEELNKYADSTGNSKTVAILQAELSELISRRNTLKNFGKNSAQLLTQREKDWAVAGGIASGIAGGAAGVATALDVQAQNAQIRAHNDQVLTQAAQAQMYIDSSGAIGRLDSQIEQKQKELDAAKIKLVGKNAPEELLGKLTFTNTNANISESGSVRVSTKIEMPEELLIYGDVVARIDGTVWAVVSKDGREISKVALVLPKYGVINGNPQEVEGITVAGVPCEEDLTVIFTATNLYAIEK